MTTTSNSLPLDAAARDELARKAESLAACLEGSDPWLKRGDLISLFPSETAEFIAACTPDVILALLASVRGAEAETARIREQSYLAGFLDGAARGNAMGYELLRAEGEGCAARYADAARAHPPAKETDADAK